MKRLIYVAILALISVSSLLAQQCANGQLVIEKIGLIENDHRHNTAFTYGMISYQAHEDNYYYETAGDPTFYLGYGKSLWVAGKDAEGNIRVSANTYPTINNHDFVAGPIDRTTGEALDTICDLYNRVWVIKQLDIFQLQAQFQETGEISIENIPLDILQWPAIGNPHLGDLAPDHDVAPFSDVNGDGIYDPVTGDFPIVLEENPGFIPHQFSFVVYNDVSRHTGTFSESMGFEFHQTNYVVNCLTESEAEQSVFTRIKYQYLGDEPLADFKLSLFEDNDLACNVNDYEGCDLDLNCTYFYNQNGESFLDQCHDPDVPDNNGAVRSTVFFSHEMQSFKHWFLLGVGDTLIPGIDPTGAAEYYNYMSGLWRFGEPVTAFGNGYETSSTDTTLFAFHDRPNDPNGWSMQTAQLDDDFLFSPLDVRALTTLVDESTLMPGATGTIDFADHFLYDKVNKRLTVFDNIWPEKINALKADFEAFKDGTFDCGGNIEICLDDCVWPGDVDQDAGVTAKDFLTAGVISAISDAPGVPRQIIATDWFAFNSLDWDYGLPEINAKHADVNGNGEINIIDFDGIASNFGENRSEFVPEVRPATRIDSFGIYAMMEEDLVDLPTATLFEKIVATDLTLGDELTRIEQPLHGVSFDMQFDTNLVRPFIKIDEIFSRVFDYNFAGMLNQSRNADNLLEGDNKISYAFTNIGGREVQLGGTLANQNLRVRDDAVTSNPDGRDTLVLKFLNICATDAAGNLYDLGFVTDSLVITNLNVDSTLISSVKEVKDDQTTLTLFPNPATDLLNVSFDQNTTGELVVYNLQGQALITKRVSNSVASQLSLIDLPVGLFMLQLETEDGLRQSELFVKE